MSDQATPYKKKLSEFGAIRRGLLKGINELQKLIYKRWEQKDELYYLLSRLHFLIWFNKSLLKEVQKGSHLAMLAARRHARLHIKIRFRGQKISQRLRSTAMSVHSKFYINKMKGYLD